MRIDHIAMYAADLAGVRDFFVRYFDAVPGALYRNTRTGFCSYFLSFADGARLEIMSRPDLAPAPDSLAYPGFIHMALSVGSREQVDDLTARLAKDGYRILSGPRTTGDGYYESCILGPENIQIEITL